MGSIYKPKYTTNGVKKESRVYWIKYYKNGRPIRESVHSTKHEDAKKLLKIREGRAAQGLPLGINLEKVIFDELAEDYLNDYEINKRRSIESAGYLVKHLGDFFNGMRVVGIRTDTVRSYLAFRKKQASEKERSLANSSLNRELEALKRMLNLGMQAGKVAQMPYIKKLEEDNVRTGYFEHDEFLALRGALPDYVKIPVTIAYYTGMRSGEIRNLKWDQVNLTEGRILLSPEQTKNKTPRMIFLAGELLQGLMMAKEVRDKKYPYCPWVCQREGKQVGVIRKPWNSALKQIGLEGRHFHDFRRTAVRNMVRAGISEKVAMSISGHKTRAIFDRYNIVSETDLKVAAEKIGALHSTMGKETGKEISFSDALKNDTMQLIDK